MNKKNNSAKSAKKKSAAAVPALGHGGVDTQSFTFWALLSFTVFFLFMAPYSRALFNGFTVDFERAIHSSLIWGAIAMLALAVYLFYHWRMRDMRDGLMIFVWLLPITYFISFISAESSYLSKGLLYVQLLQVLFFLIGAEFARNQRATQMLLFGIVGSGFAVIGFGLLHWFGSAGWLMKMFVPADAAPIYKDAVMRDSNGYRLASVFQYANTYAAYLIALLFAGVYLVIQSQRRSVVLISAWMLVPTIISFMLTLSRGAIVIIPIVLIIVLLFLPLYRQILLLLHLAVAGTISLLILERVSTIGQQVQRADEAAIGTGWALLIGTSSIAALVAWLIQRYAAPRLQQFVERRFRFKFVSFALPIVLVLVGSIGATVLFTDTGAINLLPDNIKKRVENINFAQHSVLERGTFYKDSLKLVSDYPLIGAGGGAWAALYEKYQNNPYQSRQAHSYFFQYLAEVGIIGIAILFIFLIAIFYLYIRRYIRSEDADRETRFVFFIIVISLLIHSIIDFDMSYVYLGALVFLCLGGMISTADWKLAWLEKVKLPRQRTRIIYSAAIAITAIILLIVNIRLLSANTAFLQGHAMAVEGKPFPQVMEKLDKSLNIATNHPDYTLFTVSLLHQAYGQTQDEQYYERAVQMIDSLRKAEPYNRGGIEMRFYQLVAKGQLQEALEFLDQQSVNYPWAPDFYEHRIGLNFQLGNQARLANDFQTMDLYWGHAFEVYDVMLSKIAHLATLPKEQLPGEPFEVTSGIAVSLGQINFIRGDYLAASDLLHPFIGGSLDDQNVLFATRYYLAALQMQGKEDKELYERLIAFDPEEEFHVKQLILATTATN